MANNHGGARLGAGRPPKALHYAAEIAEAEGRIVAALPELIDTLIEQAKAGDVAAARYLLDRVFGRVAAQKEPLSEDRRLPYGQEEYEADLADHQLFAGLRMG
jgi:hypothetical protein